MSFPPHVPEADGVPHHRQEEVQLAAPLLSLGLIPPPLPRLTTYIRFYLQWNFFLLSPAHLECQEEHSL